MLARLILINRYFYPDESATSQMASSLAFDLSAAGWTIDAITSRQHYTPSFARQPASDHIRDLRIHRLWTSRLGHRHLLGRAIDYLTFYLSAFLWLILFARRGDVIVTLTDPPLMSVLSTLAARIRSCRHINWLQDLFPEIACQLGVVSPGFLSRMITRQRNRALRRATMNVVIGDHMARFLEQQNVPRSAISVIHNWSDGTKISPRSPDENPIRREWALEGKFVVGYSGNLGRAHDFQTILQAAVALRDDAVVRFLFIGGGHYFGPLRDEVQRLSLSNVVIRPYQPDSRLRDSLTLPDLHLISLQPSLEGLIVPSKFYGIAAAGRPTIFIGDRLGEIPNILRTFDCGTSVAIGDGISLVENIKALQYDTKQRDAWGENARALLVARFDRPHAVRQWMRVLESGIAPQEIKLQATSTNIINNA